MNNYDYPMGADTKNAPWNEVEVPEKEFNITISQTLSKTTSVTTNDYLPSIDETEEGKYPFDDTSDTNWMEAYDNEHYTPLELIGVLDKLLDEPDVLNILGERQHKRIKKECSNWIEDETVVVEE